MNDGMRVPSDSEVLQRVNAMLATEDRPTVQDLVKALAVMVLDAKIRAFLLNHDPKAFRQALTALGVSE